MVLARRTSTLWSICLIHNIFLKIEIFEILKQGIRAFFTVTVTFFIFLTFLRNYLLIATNKFEKRQYIKLFFKYKGLCTVHFIECDIPSTLSVDTFYTPRHILKKILLKYNKIIPLISLCIPAELLGRMLSTMGRVFCFCFGGHPMYSGVHVIHL